MRRLVLAIVLTVAVSAGLPGVDVRPAAAATRDRRAYLLGDSVMHGAPRALQERLANWQLTINTYVGRFLHHGLDTLREERHRIHGVAVIHLGNNYLGNRAAFARQLDEAMRILRGVDRVLWVTTHNQSDGVEPVNAELRAVAARWDNARIVDWRALGVADAELTWDDGTHLTPKGQRAYADLFARHLTDWLRPTDRCHAPTAPAPSPSDASGRGYRLLATDGTVHGFDISTHGDLRTRKVPNRPVGIASTASGRGYWLLDERGGVHAFGDAPFHGSMAGRIDGPARRIAAGPTGGYWVWADERVTAFGPAKDRRPPGPGTPSPTGGHWLGTADGSVYTQGTSFHGSLPGLGFCHPQRAVQLVASATGRGYWIVTEHGAVYSFGDAKYRGGSPDLPPGVRIIDAAAGR